jgi:type I restriction enzyme, S subunit
MKDRWAIASGEDLFSSVRGVSYAKSDASGLPGSGLVPILRANNISADGRIIADDLVYVPKRYVSPEQFLKDGDLLIAASSGSRSVVGKAAQAGPEHSRFAFGAFCTVARPRCEEFGLWLSSYMKSRAYRVFVEGVALGININNLRSSDLKAIPIWIAPLSEQRRVVTKVNSLCATSNRARDQLNHIPRLIEKYKKAVLAAAFKGKLTREWRRSHPDVIDAEHLMVDIRDLHRAKWQETHKAPFVPHAQIAIDNKIFEIPRSWCWVAAEEIVGPGADIVYGIVQPGPRLASGVLIPTISPGCTDLISPRIPR